MTKTIIGITKGRLAAFPTDWSGGRRDCLTYQVDLGCPSINPTGGTTFITVSHPKYNAGGGVVGRGVFGVVRYDIALEPR